MPLTQETTTEEGVDNDLILATAVAEGDLRTVQNLIEGGADVETEDALGRNLLLLASQ